MTPADRDAAVALARAMTPQHVRHAARWLQRQDAAQQARAAALEAGRRTDQHARRQRVARQARDAPGRWVRG